MARVTKRLSWVDTFVDREGGPPLKKEYLFVVDDILHGLWALGRNIILLWTPRRAGMTVLIVPHYLIASAGVDGADGGSANIATLLQSVLAGPKMVAPDRLEELARLLNCKLEHIELPFTPGEGLPFKAIDSVLKRYCVTFVEDRAVVLFDVVGFSLFSPLEQVAQLNSLAYSVNSAYSKLLDKNIEVSFARITTGDGFYVWNRRRNIRASIEMYLFMHLVIADNAIARGKTVGNTTPLLRTCFHVGGHYEFYQSEGLSPTTFSYIVGDVTIELARMIEVARPGQILVGDFPVREIDAETDETVVADTVSFIDRAQETLANLNGLELSGDHIESIKCYLTGAKQANDGYTIKRYRISDKHGFNRYVYNAKVNIYRSHADPIYLGVQDAELTEFGASEPYVGGVFGKSDQEPRCIPPLEEEYAITKRRRFTADFRARVAVEALRGDETVQEIAAKHKVHPNQVSSWKRQAVDGLSGVFSNGADRAHREHDGEVGDLHARSAN